MFQPVEQSSQPSGFARTDASERGDPLSGENLVDANGKDKVGATANETACPAGKLHASRSAHKPSPENVAMPPSGM